MKRLAIVLLLCAATGAAHSGFDDGNKLHTQCSDMDVRTGNTMVCMSVAGAYYDMMEMIGYRCRFSKGITKGQAADVLRKYLNDHPATRNQPAASLAFAAFKEAFACELKLNP
ncbi:hypothetical protein BH10PSE10_BH10PSE10_23210 [soil metagenome]